MDIIVLIRSTMCDNEASENVEEDYLSLFWFHVTKPLEEDNIPENALMQNLGLEGIGDT
jgi:hypothetical protein